jgi:hypothetical protein
MVGRSAFEAQLQAVAGGIAMMLLLYVSVPLCIVGFGFGLVGLIAYRRNRNHLFTWTGLCGNALVIMSVVGLHVYGAVQRTNAIRKHEEQARLQQEAIRLQEEAIRLEAEARYRKEEARRKEEDMRRKEQEALQKDLDKHISNASLALKVNDEGTARKEIALAEKYKPHDVRITELKAELNYRRLVGEANAFLAKGALDQALASFKQALEIRPKEVTVQNSSSVIMHIQAAKPQLQQAKKLLRDKSLEAACDEGKKAADMVLGIANLVVDDSRFQATLQKLAKETAEGLWELVLGLRTASQTDKDSAGLAISNEELAAALKDFDRAGNRLAKAKNLLVALRLAVFGENPAAITKATGELDAEIAAIEVSKKNVEGQQLLQSGRSLLKVGQAHLDGAAKEPARLLAAQRAYREAVMQLGLAKDIPGIDAEPDLQNARNSLGKVTQTIEPINVDFESTGFKADWSFSQKQWVLWKRQPWAWFQTAAVMGANLRSPLVTHSREFEFQFGFAVLDEHGLVRNEWLQEYRGLLKVTLVAKAPAGDNAVLEIGQDPNTKYERVACIEIDKRRYTLRKLAKTEKTEPINVRLVRYKDRATVTFGSRQIASFPMSTDFKQVVFSVNNGVNHKQQVVTSVALTGVSLRLHVEGQPELRDAKLMSRQRNGKQISDEANNTNA